MHRLLLTVLVALALSGTVSACGSLDTGGTSGAPAPGRMGGGAADAAAAPTASGTDAASPASLGDATDGAPDPPAPPQSVRILGYYTGDQDSYDAITSFHANLTTVSTDVYAAQADGGIKGSDARNALAAGKAHGLDTFACVSNYSEAAGDFDATLAHAVIVTHRDAMIANLVNLAKTGFRGVNIDFEGIAFSASVADDRAAFSAFVRALAAPLHAAGLQLMISVPAKTAESPNDAWSYPYDFAALAGDIDYLQLMTYDENGPDWSAPGPVAGVDWTEACVKYAAPLVGASKVLIGLPAYGYDWDLTASTKSRYVGREVSWKATPALLATPGAVRRWDAAASSPSVTYTSADGHAHEAWYENAESVKAKARLVGKYALGGVSVWALPHTDQGFWQSVADGL